MVLTSLVEKFNVDASFSIKCHFEVKIRTKLVREHRIQHTTITFKTFTLQIFPKFNLKTNFL